MEIQTYLDNQDRPFVISGDEQALMDIAEALRSQQRHEYAKHIVRHVITAPVRATAVLAKDIGSAIAANVRDTIEDYELKQHDQAYGTNLYAQKQKQIVARKTAALMHRAHLA